LVVRVASPVTQQSHRGELPLQADVCGIPHQSPHFSAGLPELLGISSKISQGWPA
jgi:hypothetical protein